ncbi:extracellular catalytic domain type 1 short-chain-length polyhydroxyalkanoate depolymerase [Rhizobium sp. No.120]
MPEHMNSRRLIELRNFGSNPGLLKCWLYLPTILAPKTPLVVVLHGCTQNAATYDHGTGWSKMAEEKGFALLFPEQQRANNANLCFNWFEPGDIRRDAGEALSIREMIGHVVEAHGIDPGKIFITGLSAGGAMANVMLATYPELFAAGAIIGGLPYGTASGVGQAFERMRGQNAPSVSQMQSALTTAASSWGAFPSISVWHGTHDQTVKPVNAEQIVHQWAGVHHVSDTPYVIGSINRHSRKVWLDESGKPVIEVNLIKAMAHGVPLSFTAKAPLGNSGPFMLEAGISSTARIARSWGLADDADVAIAEEAFELGLEHSGAPSSIEAVIAKAMAFAKPGLAHNAVGRDDRGVGKVINDALRAAGLMR